MRSFRNPLVFGAAAWAAAASAQTPPLRVPPPVVRTPLPPPPISTTPPGAPYRPMPAAPRVRILDQPDWSDPDIYPADAYDLGQEGDVTFELDIGRNGVPRTCWILRSSGHAELDLGSCSLGRRMRFEPPRDAAGRPAESRYRARIVWVFSPPDLAFAPSTLRADLLLDAGRPVSCALSGSGPLYSHWARFACSTFTAGAAYYLGPQRFGARRATILVDLVPAGSSLPPPPRGAGRLAAERRTEFAISSDGVPQGCRISLARGLGPAEPVQTDPCGFFFARGMEFEPADEDSPLRRGTVELRALLRGR